jgi:cbb3-type cytochrome oxidase maturation protein
VALVIQGLPPFGLAVPDDEVRLQHERKGPDRSGIRGDAGTGRPGVSILVLLIPIALCLGLTALVAFLWNLRSGQYEDLSGAAERVLLDEEDVPAYSRQKRKHAAQEQPRS